MQITNWLELLSTFGIGSIISAVIVAVVGAFLKWLFDRAARRREVFIETFKRFSSLTADYYMPMAVLAGRCGRLLRNVTDKKPTESEFVFFNLSRFYLYVLHYILHGGGYLMRDWKDDAVQRRLYGEARDAMQLSDTDISTMQLNVEGCENYLKFKGKLQNPGTGSKEEKDLGRVFKRFTVWIAGNPEDVTRAANTLRCYSENMLCVIDRLYGAWYHTLLRRSRPLPKSCKKEISRIRKQIRADMKAG